MLRLWGRRVERDSDCLTCLWDPSLTGINTLKRDSPTPCAANWRNVPENLLWVSWFLSLTRNSKRLQRRQAKSWSLGTATVSCWVPPFLLKRRWCFLLTISWVRRASWGLSEVCILGNRGPGGALRMDLAEATVWCQPAVHCPWKQVMWGVIPDRVGFVGDGHVWGCFVYVCVQLLSRVQFFCSPIGCSPPGSSAHGIFQTRINGVGYHFLF